MNFIYRISLPNDRQNVDKMIFSLFDRVENIVGKGENAGYQHFLLFSHCFFFHRVVKICNYMVKRSAFKKPFT